MNSVDVWCGEVMERGMRGLYSDSESRQPCAGSSERNEHVPHGKEKRDCHISVTLSPTLRCRSPAYPRMRRASGQAEGQSHAQVTTLLSQRSHRKEAQRHLLNLGIPMGQTRLVILVTRLPIWPSEPARRFNVLYHPTCTCHLLSWSSPSTPLLNSE